MSEQRHIPVLLEEVLLALAPAPGGIYVDGTFGQGGYTRAILEHADCRVVALDRDPVAIAAGRAMEEDFAGRLTVVEGCFSDMETLLNAIGIDRVDGVALDLGVSSPQLDDPARGFSFRSDGPLDMRMGTQGRDAADIINSLPESELADIIFRFGEERLSRRVARAIVHARREARIEGTLALARIVRSAVGPAAGDGLDPATRTFQALRIYVNDELRELELGLAAAERLLRAGGRLAIVSFHSLEDRIVKLFLRDRTGAAPAVSRHLPSTAAAAPASFQLVARKPILPGAAETRRNPRSRSARLRVAQRTAFPALAAALSAEARP